MPGIGILRLRWRTSRSAISAQNDGIQERARDFCANVSLDPQFLRGHVKARRTVNAVRVEQCHRRHIEPGTHSRHILGQRRTFEEAESGTGVKLDVQMQYPVPSTQSNICGDATGYWVLSTGYFFFSHTFLPQTIHRRADRAPVGRGRQHQIFARRYPTRRAPRLRAPTSRRNCARGRLSRAQCPALLFS